MLQRFLFPDALAVLVPARRTPSPPTTRLRVVFALLVILRHIGMDLLAPN
jgi:hypothetical protein